MKDHVKMTEKPEQPAKQSEKDKKQKLIRPKEDKDNSFLEDLISERTYVRLSNQLIKVLPDHWVEKISDIVTFQVFGI